MAERQNKIKVIFDLDVDGVVQGGTKVKAVFDEQTKLLNQVRSASELNEGVQKVYNNTVAAQTYALETLLGTINKINSQPQLEDTLALHIAEAAASKYNATLEETASKLQRILDIVNQGSLRNISSVIPRITTETPAPTLPTYTGGENTAWVQSEALTAYQQRQKEIAANTTLTQQRESEKRIAIEKNEQTKRTAYVNDFLKHFETAEQKRTNIEANRKVADARGYTPMAYGTVGANRAAVDTKATRDFNLVNRQLEITNAKRLAQEELYANYARKQKEELNNRLLQIDKDRAAQEDALRASELAKLRQDITTRSNLEAERVAREIQVESDRASFVKAQREQELNLLRQDITRRSSAAQEVAGQNLSEFQTTQLKQQAALQASIDRQVAIEKYGTNSIQVTRLDAANKIKGLQQNLANSIETIQQRVRSGSINAEQATAGLAKVHGAYKEAVLGSTIALNQQEAAHIHSANTQRNMFVRIGEIIGIYRVYITVLEGVKQALLAVPQSGIALETTIASLTATFGNFAGASKELEFIRQEADRTGIAIRILRDSYSQASASFIASGESAETTRKIFQNINTVSTTLHLSADKTSSIYLALSQIFNKTKLQAEELTKQLSQTIPGVTAAQAEALQVTVSELYDSMKKGTISAHDAIIKLSEELATTYGGEAFIRATSGLNAAIGRVNTSWTILTENIYKASAKMLISIVDFATGTVKSIGDVTSNTYNLEVSFSKIAGTVTGLIVGYAAAVIGIKAYSEYTKLAALDTVALQGKLVSLGQTLKSGLFVAAIAELGSLIGKTAAFRAELTALDNKVAEIEGRTKAAKGTPAEQLQYNVSINPEVKVAEAQAEEAKKRYERYSQGFFKASADDIQKAYHTYNVLAQEVTTIRTKVSRELEASAKQTEEHIVVPKIDVSDAIARAETDYLKATGNKVKAARQAFLNSNKKDINDLMLAYAQGNKEAGEALSKLQQSYLKQGLDVKTGGGGAAKSEKISLRDYERDLKYSQQAIDDEITQYDRLYKFQAIGITEYYNEKNRLVAQSSKLEIEAFTKAAEEAAKVHDIDKVKEYSDKLTEAYRKVSVAQKELLDNKLADELKFNDILAQVNAEYARLTGGLGGISTANQREANDQFRERTNLIKAQIDDGRTQYADELAKQEVITQQTASLKTINDYQGKIKKMLDVIAATEEKIDRDRASGAITSASAAKELGELRNRYFEVILQSTKAIDAEAAANRNNLEIELARLEAHGQLARLSGNSAGEYLKQVSASQEDPASKIKNVWETSRNNEARFESEKANKLLEINAKYYNDKAKLQEESGKVEKEYGYASMANTAGMFQGMFAVGSETFMGLTESATKMYGAQSKQAKQAFMAYKAMKMAETVAATAQAVVVALGAGPYIGVALAAVAAAMGAFQIAKIAALQPPAAHGGLDYVPKEQTYLLDKGERVISPRQNRDLTKFINNSTINNNQSGSSIRIINVQDTGMIKDYLGSSEGEEVVVNIMRRNEESA